ncbi:glutamate racemase [Paenibacillus baekrokdamisoli]|uniref:Glutamate racemase n=1 Tax=Paenibacillus baekrokdamisoli TaxID=1712516 RepID=A0A3G9ISV6_9BACL|nr:glutamate racemase [Paenibacillus baekrokdamisoli]MBB3067710.1 glutamate racemase [Paenibacillus baekrokdamisoli]BBH19105.1 glutamate racemase [Paenibacillus baekrokdamisoli]
MQQPIAVLDSGVGGLTVVREVMRQLPREKIIYFGDTARTPYGPRPAEEVTRFTREIVDYLIQFRPKMIVIACNTATAVALEDIRSRVTIPVVGVIHPGARAANGRTQSGVVGVIGTEGTIRSAAYEHALKGLSPNLEVISLACPRFVPLVEQGNFRSAETYEVVQSSLESLKCRQLDTLILGCTHYPFLADTISEVMGNNVTLINSADETAREISTILHDRNRLARNEALPVHQFFCSGDPRMFKTIAQQWLGEQIELTPVVWQVPQIG